MTYQINKLTTKTWKETYNDALRTVRNGMIALGISDNPQLGPGSDEELWARVAANETQPLYVNAQITADEQMPDTASLTDPPTPVGKGLVRLMAIKGLAPRDAVGSVGFIVLACSVTTSIASATKLVDANGLRYEVTASGTYANGALVPIQAVDTGAVTNRSAGDVLVWYGTPPAFCNPKQSVATGGLTGGSDQENTETARSRLIDREQNPPGSGNAAQAIDYAEKSTPLVQKGFCHPAVNGPSTCHVSVTAAPTTTSQSRQLNALVLANTVAPYVAGKMPEFTEVVVTTVQDDSVDVALGLTLPSSPQASPAGPGGGWIDGTPWPAISGTGSTYVNVSAITSSTQFTVTAPTAPTDGISHICMWDLVQGKLLRAKVLSHSGTSGAYVITIDTPFPNLAVSSGGDSGTLIFPDATNMSTYVTAFLTAMSLMGPGEKTANVSVLARGFRHPPPQSSWQSALNATQLKKVEDTGDEVLDTAWYYRSTITPPLPVSVSNAPLILVTRRLGFYPI